MTRPKMLIALNSGSAAGQGFTNFFVRQQECLLIRLSVLSQFFYYRVLHSMIYASHGIGDSSKWIMDIVENVRKVLHFLSFQSQKDNQQFEGKYGK